MSGKNHFPVSRILATALTLASALTAVSCSSGNVMVNATGAGTGNGSGADSSERNGVQKGDTGTPAQTAPGSDKPQGSTDLLIFFERVRAMGGMPQYFMDVSFLPQQAHGSLPFGVPLKTLQDFGPNPVFAPAADQVFVLSRSTGTDSLISASLSTFRPQPVFSFPRPVADFALSPDHGLLAWVGEYGTLSVSALGGDSQAPVRTLDLAGYRGKSVAWNATATRLLMRTDKDAWVYSVDSSGQLEQQAVFRDVTASAFSPEGDRVAVVGKKDRVLRIVDLSGGSGSALLTLDSSELYDFSWTQHGIAYWVRLVSGFQEIRSLMPTKDAAVTLSERTIARLSVPLQTQGGVVCPAWADGGASVYYGDFLDGAYVIEHVGGLSEAAPKALSKATTFVQAQASDEGFVCPRSE